MNIERSKQILDGLSRFAFEDDMKLEFEASPKLLLEIELFTDEQIENIVKEMGMLMEASYWVALREAVEKELCKK